MATALLPLLLLSWPPRSTSDLAQLALNRLTMYDFAADEKGVGRQLQQFGRLVWDNTLVLGAGVGFLFFVALAMDGVFVDHERFV